MTPTEEQSAQPQYIHMFEHFIRVFCEMRNNQHATGEALNYAAEDALRRFKDFTREAKESRNATD